MLPKVSPQIVVSPRNQTVPEGNTTKFFCKATGFPKPTVSWKFNDGRLPSLAIEKHTEVGSNLFLSNVTKDVEGTYRCTAENKANTTSSISTLRVLGKYQTNQRQTYIHEINKVEERFEILAVNDFFWFWKRVLNDFLSVSEVSCKVTLYNRTSAYGHFHNTDTFYYGQFTCSERNKIYINCPFWCLY